MFPQTDNLATRQIYLGLFIISCTTLLYETLLTRIFSVTLWYHFAFMAISIAMFGMSVGATIVYLLPRWFAQRHTHLYLITSALFFALSIIVSFALYLKIKIALSALNSMTELAKLFAIYVLTSIPFLFSGICICLALTRFPKQINSLYAADLMGGALGCIGVIAILHFADGPTAVLLTAFIASLGAICFSVTSPFKVLKKTVIGFSATLLLMGSSNLLLTQYHRPLLQINWVKGAPAQATLYEKWNSFSQITLSGDPEQRQAPFGWGLSSQMPKHYKTQWLLLKIDALAATPLIRYQNHPESVAYLKYEIANLAHYLRKNAKVLIVGTGGGKDILSALVFQQKSIFGIEINNNIFELLTHLYADYTGYLNKNPAIQLINDEARSYISRSDKKFDVIQLSLIDTWAATAAGAFTLSENSLYTLEAWQIFLRHLTSHGVLTVSRWYYPKSPAEMYRLTALASESLRQLGISHPRQHMMIVANTQNKQHPDSVATLLVSPTPFSVQDIVTMTKVANKMHFTILLSPFIAKDPAFTALTSPITAKEFIKTYPLNIAPPTDDCPYFFQMFKLHAVLGAPPWKQGSMTFNPIAVFVLGALLVMVITLTTLCIILPLFFSTKRTIVLRDGIPLLLFFAAIGMGFMFIEIAQIQRLITFLGHPSYGLSVVLATLLLTSGLGSLFTTQFIKSKLSRLIYLLIATLLLCGWLTPWIIAYYQQMTTPIRITIAIASLSPLGLLLGTLFPLGMRLTQQRATTLTPWLWGINGATSVCATVLATMSTLSFGITATYWMGVICYLGAVILLYTCERRI